MTLIYHIAHIDRLASILDAGFLYSDAEVHRQNVSGTVIGMQHIKDRRLGKPIECFEGLNVGDCVPFYFCPRSVMLYILHKGNHPDVSYAGGERPILHLEFDAESVKQWADEEGLRVAFTDRNAGSATAEFRSDMSALQLLNWSAINAADWRDCIEEKQAEFLVERRVPISLLTRIGVKDSEVQQNVWCVMRKAGMGNVPVEVLREWYY